MDMGIAKGVEIFGKKGCSFGTPGSTNNVSKWHWPPDKATGTLSAAARVCTSVTNVGKCAIFRTPVED